MPMTSFRIHRVLDRLVGEAISAWETIRPEQPLLFDAKTSDGLTTCSRFAAGASALST